MTTKETRIKLTALHKGATRMIVEIHANALLGKIPYLSIENQLAQIELIFEKELMKILKNIGAKDEGS